VVEKLKSIWVNGRLVPWDEARFHVLAHTLHYGLGVFEGIRSYRTESGRPAVFRLRDHIRRFLDSAKIAFIAVPYSLEELCDAVVETLGDNGLDEGYVRPIAFLGEGTMGVFPQNNPTQVAIAVWRWGAYLGEEALRRGVRTRISSFARYQPNTMMTSAKLTGNYTTSVLAKMEVKKLGYDEAILLDVDGYVAEGSGENIFIVRDGVIKTTPLTCILPGITRDTVFHIARDLGYEIVEMRFSRDELYIADEAFFTGTASEVTPIREVDDRTIGSGEPGPITKRIQEAFFEIVRGKSRKYARWLTYYDLAASSSRPRNRARAPAP
jgi:branched-chain amino acid aminotransferase